MVIELRKLGLLVGSVAALATIAIANNALASDEQTGFWNTNLAQQNVVECHNLSLKSRQATLSIYSSTQQLLASLQLSFEGRGTQHLVLNQHTAANQYGTFVISSSETGGTPGTLQCHTAVYRLAEAAMRGKAVEYAYALPAAKFITGESSGAFNSMDPEGGTNTVFNWLSIYNASGSGFSGRVEVYDLQGNLIPAQGFAFADIRSGERVDFPLGHPHGQTIGLYRIVPANPATRHAAFMVRYAPRDAGFTFALPLLAAPLNSSGFENGCHESPVFASTMDPALNWAEVINFSSTPGTATLEIYNQRGELLGSRELHLNGFGQQHIRINDFLGDRNIGLLRLRCAPGSSGRIGLESLYYGLAPQGTLEWAYAAQQASAEGQLNTVVANSVNTYLGAANWGLYINHASTGSGHDLRMLTTNGSIAAERSFFLPQSGSIAQDIHSAVGRDFVGLSFSRSLSATALYSTELLRAYPTTTGRIGYIMRTPSYSAALSSTTAYFRVQVAEQSFVMKLTDPEKITQARGILRDPSRNDRHVLGRVVATPGEYNSPWAFSLDSNSIQFFEQSVEVCDYPISLVESEIRAQGQVNLPNQIWCPWSSKIVEELVY